MTNKNTRGIKNHFSFFILHLSLIFTSVVSADLSKSGNIVTDSNTRLQWQDDAIGTQQISWTAAIDYCESLNLDSQNDWRLPNLKELTSIMDDTKRNPSIDTAVFANTASNDYWSSTTLASYSYAAWHVDFYYGNQGGNDKSVSYYVRCVRDGQ